MRRIEVRCTAPITILQGIYDKIVDCDSEIIAKARAFKNDGTTTSYGSTRKIRWVLRPDGIHLGLVHLNGFTPLIRRNGYEITLRCGRGHHYELKPGEMIQCI